MNIQKKLMILATMLAFLIMLPVVRASEEDQATNSPSIRPCRFQGAFCLLEPIGSCCWKPTPPLTSFKFTIRTDPRCTQLF